MRLLSKIFTLFATLLAVNAANAANIPLPSDTVPVVSLITVGRGNEMYQLEGHTAIRIQLPEGYSGISSSCRDISVNWGVFDYHSPNFAWRFIKGETDYSLGLAPMRYMVSEYAHEGRELTEQVLSLTPIETETLCRLVAENNLPQNRTYRYNYVHDNCATRPLAIIERAVEADGARLRFDMPQTDTSFREEMRRYHKDFPAYQMFIDLVLGSGLDYRITPRQQAFAPLFLEDLAAHTYIVAADGEVRPLVKSTVQLLPPPPHPAKEGGVPPWIIVFGIFAAAIAVTIYDFMKKKQSRWFDAIFYSIYGIVGLLVAFLVFISMHEATSPNINLLWINPLCLIVPIFIAFRRCRMIVFYYQIANFALMIVWLAGIPFFHQSINALFIPLVLGDMLRSIRFIIANKPCKNAE